MTLGQDDNQGSGLPGLTDEPRSGVPAGLVVVVVVGLLVAGGVVLIVTSLGGSKHHGKPVAATPTATTAATAPTASTPGAAAQPAPTVKPAPHKLHVAVVTSRTTLLRTPGFTRALSTLQHRLGADALVAHATVTPTELDLVIADGVQGRTVTLTAGGRLTIGPPLGSIRGQQAVELGQIHAHVPAHLAHEVSAHHGGHLAKMLLDTGRANSTAGWELTSTGPVRHATALLDGTDFRSG